jgi:hypothetical protein
MGAASAGRKGSGSNEAFASPAPPNSTCARIGLTKLSKAGVFRFGARLNLTGNYPNKLRDARHPIEMLYFQGTWELAETRSVAVVGSRNATEDGKKRAAKISKALVEKGFTVVSGLAAGIDAAAHTAAVEAGGQARRSGAADDGDPVLLLRDLGHAERNRRVDQVGYGPGRSAGAFPDRVYRSTNGAVAVGVVLEVRLEDRFQHELGGGLYYPIPDGRHSPIELHCSPVSL